MLTTELPLLLSLQRKVARSRSKSVQQQARNTINSVLERRLSSMTFFDDELEKIA